MIYGHFSALTYVYPLLLARYQFLIGRQPPFDYLEQQLDKCAKYNINHKDDQICLNVIVAVCRAHLCNRHDILNRHHKGERGAFEQADRRVAQVRERRHQRLRNQDARIRLVLGEPDGERRLHLPASHGQNRRAEHLREHRRRVQPEHNKRVENRRNNKHVKAQLQHLVQKVVQKRRQEAVQKQNLQDDRRAPDKRDITAYEFAPDPFFVQPPKRHEKCGRRGQKQRHQSDFQRDGNAAQRLKKCLYHKGCV